MFLIIFWLLEIFSYKLKIGCWTDTFLMSSTVHWHHGHLCWLWKEVFGKAQLSDPNEVSAVATEGGSIGVVGKRL